MGVVNHFTLNGGRSELIFFILFKRICQFVLKVLDCIGRADCTAVISRSPYRFIPALIVIIIHQCSKSV